MDVQRLAEGFVTHYVEGLTKILLPSSVARAIEAEREAAQQAAVKKVEAAAEKPTEVELEEEPAAPQPAEGPGVVVYHRAEIKALAERIKLLRDADDAKRLKRVSELLVRGGCKRRFAQLSDPAAILELMEQFPNFCEVISFIHEQLLLARGRATCARIPPLLLAGPAGIGKTEFCKALAAKLDTGFAQVNFDTPVSSATLLGLDRQWGNSVHGLVFEKVCLGDVANPLFVLEELDKAHRDLRDDPVAALHTLLEQSSAGTVKDISLGFVFDAGYVTWIATANYPWLIPPTIRSRLREFDVPAPSGQAAIAIAQRVLDVTLQRQAPAGFGAPSRLIAVALAHLTPREVVRATIEMLGRAVANGRNQLALPDVPNWAREEGEGGDSAQTLH